MVTLNDLIQQVIEHKLTIEIRPDDNNNISFYISKQTKHRYTKIQSEFKVSFEFIKAFVNEDGSNKFLSANIQKGINGILEKEKEQAIPNHS